MNKYLAYIFFSMILVVSACSHSTEGNVNDNDNESASSTLLETSSEQRETTNTEVEVEGEEDAQKDETEQQTPLYELNEVYSVVPIDDANPKVVLLTFDDAPDKRALDIAKTLKQLDAPAIFFVNGHFLQSDEKKKVLQEIHDMGFMIGNHTKTHANLKTLSEDEQREEIVSVNDDVEAITGERPVFFRAPFGANTDFSRSLVEQEGMLLMNWSYGYDFEKEYMSKEKIADIMVNTELLRDGANLLMHDRDWTADALEDIITGLRNKGYDFVDPRTIRGVGEE
ncbi:polysaccharide deacetylase family protein [Sporosarcina sp. Te-1]|uniref:polysaccharide deacetylase family protein n=1 Tax=Sporosarcina sp. Te-1 TaxID=2818390 RepID=UPI001A9FBFDD|nr:polysaccharide deacetylase family protein [Sporosarcina sp. Te-1]QTD42455.1 polysaccharide deacetylase family protein [Sporosarcina sp. Te-1]